MCGVVSTESSDPAGLINTLLEAKSALDSFTSHRLHGYTMHLYAYYAASSP